MDKIIEKFIKKISLDMALKCLMLEYEVIPGFIYNDKVNKSTLDTITNTFKTFVMYNTRHGILFTLKTQSVPFDVYNYKDSDLYDFLNNDFGDENIYTFKARAIYRDYESIMFVLPCKSNTCDNLKNFIRRLERFINKLNEKLKHKIIVHVTVKRTIDVDKLEEYMKEHQLKRNDKYALAFLTVAEEHNYKRLLKLNKEVNIFTKKYRTLLNSIIKLCAYEKYKLFDPTDKSVKDHMVDDFIERNIRKK